jgi:hypothetical protein
MTIKHKRANPSLGVIISLILLVTLISALYEDLAGADSLSPYRNFQNLDQECPFIYGNDSFDGLALIFFFALPGPISSLTKEPSYPLCETPFLCQETLVLRC